jgi:hypothetical protein
VFVHNGREVRHGHILPNELRWLNILEPIRAEVREYLDKHKEVKLHKYFHHLNSSQAFALNLFFPYFEQGSPSELLRAMNLSGELASWQPEYVDDPNEGTNFDIMWVASDGGRTFCEVKLSEQEFGTASDDRRHRQKLEDIYRPVLAGQCAPALLEPSTFFSKYQLLRNVWAAAKDKTASVVFLVPKANSTLWQELGPLIEQLSPTLARRVHAVAMEDVLEALSSSSPPQARLTWYAHLLREKYVAPHAAA